MRGLSLLALVVVVLIVGLLASRQTAVSRAPTTVIGVRGTDFIVEENP